MMSTEDGVARDLSMLALSVEILNASASRRRRIVSALERDGIDVAEQAARYGTSQEPARARCDAVVVDLHRADSSADDLRAIVEQAGGTPVVVISAASDRRTMRLALAAGVDGFVLDDELEACLPAAVRGVCAGQLSLPRGARDIVARPTLSTREKQILGMVVLGFSNGEIAAQALARGEHGEESPVVDILEARCPLSQRGHRDDPRPRHRARHGNPCDLGGTRAARACGCCPLASAAPWSRR